jgi:hypothetical protein
MSLFNSYASYEVNETAEQSARARITAGQRDTGKVGFGRRSQAPLAGNSGNRNAAVDDSGACGSKVLVVN